MNEGVEYVAAVYGIVLATLVLWLWIMARKIQRLDRERKDDGA